jgi:hypothetical protein
MHIQNPLIYLFLLSLLVSVATPSSPSTSTMTIASVGSGGISLHSDRQGQSSAVDLGVITGGENYHEWTAGSQIVTGPGYTSYSEKTKENSQYQSTYDSQNSLVYEGGAAISNTYTMTDNKPNVADVQCTAGDIGGEGDGVTATGEIINGQLPSQQGVEVRYDGIGVNGRYKSAAVIEDVNFTTSMRAEGDLGSITTYHSSLAQAGFDKNTTDMNYEVSNYGHISAYGSENGSYSQAFDWEWLDHSVPFETNETVISTINQTNQTEAV